MYSHEAIGTFRGVEYKQLQHLFDEVRRLHMSSGRDRQWLEEEVEEWTGLRPVKPHLKETSPIVCLRCLVLVHMRTGGMDYFPIDIEERAFSRLPKLKKRDLSALVIEYLDSQRVGRLPPRLAENWKFLGRGVPMDPE